MAWADRQDQERGAWPRLRGVPMGGRPSAPWPEKDNPVLAYLLEEARKDARELDTDTAMIQLAVHAWFEGHIEGYDHGQRDARTPRPVEF